MANFVLVHGAWHGGWCWRRVIDLLQAAGHRAFAPTLTGLGERAHLLSPQVGLSTHIDDVVAVLDYEGLDDVVLCGHSYGGMVITGVADRVPERLHSLVYLDALLPTDGQCTFDILLPDRVTAFRQSAEASGEGWRIAPVPAERFGVTDPADRAWVDAMCGSMPLRAFEERIHLENGAPECRHTYILAGNYKPSQFQQIYARLKDDPAWHRHSLPCGHDVMVVMPQELTDLLLAEVA